ncbi:MAG: hypothetical protein RIA63_04415 [Cyclobacteriaceae bacterium]
MLPNGNEWKSWNGLEKATYVANFLMPIALMITVIFSYLSWRESNLARINQNKFFSASNAPKLEVRSYFVRSSFPIWTMSLKNTGESTAFRVCVIVNTLGNDFTYENTCRDSEIFKNITVRKGETVELPLVPANDFEQNFGFIPRKTFMTKQEDYLPDDFSYYLITKISYYDAADNHMVELIPVSFQDESGN